MITVVIPTIQGREEFALFKCIISLMNQDYVKWNLVIVTTNPNLCIEGRDSSTPINKFLHSIKAQHKIKIVYDTLQQGPGAAFTQGLEWVDTEYVLRVDDDVILTSSVVNKLLEGFQKISDLGAISSPVNGFGVLPVPYRQYWARSISPIAPPHLLLNGRIDKMNDNFVHHSALENECFFAEVDFLSGYCIMFETEVIKKIGYTNEGSPKFHCEDWYATLKLKANNKKLIIRGDCCSYHHHYIKDASHIFGGTRSSLDRSLFDKFKSTVNLPKDRHIGLL